MRKKKSYLKKNIPKAHCYFKILIATYLLFWPVLISKVLEVWPFSFIKTNYFCFPKSPCWFFSCKTFATTTSHQTIDISVFTKRSNIAFNASFHMSFHMGWDLTNFHSKESRIVQNALLCTAILSRRGEEEDDKHWPKGYQLVRAWSYRCARVWCNTLAYYYRLHTTSARSAGNLALKRFLAHKF